MIEELVDDDEQCVIDWDENQCVGCGEMYTKTMKKEDWIKCVKCMRWLHEGCSRFENECDHCGMSK